MKRLMHLLKNRRYRNQLCSIECPNCWGHSEWNYSYTPATINTKRRPKTWDGFIQNFVKKHIA